MSSTILSIGSIEIKWYSFLLLVAFTIGYLLILHQSNKIGISKSIISDLLFYLVIVCIVGARLYYCLFNLDYYLTNPIDILKIWEGGLAIHGGIIAGFIYLFIFCKYKKINILKITDIIVPALALGQAIGRWGNFFNQEAYGPVTTYSFLHSLHIPNFIIDGMYINNQYHHPTFLYESIWCLLIFILLVIFMKLIKAKFGTLTAVYLILYGIERYFIEGLRQDSLMFFQFKIAQIVSLLMVIIGVIILLILRKKNEYDK